MEGGTSHAKAKYKISIRKPYPIMTFTRREGRSGTSTATKVT